MISFNIRTTENNGYILEVHENSPNMYNTPKTFVFLSREALLQQINVLLSQVNGVIYTYSSTDNAGGGNITFSTAQSVVGV
jgi:hypothetical protein